VSVAFRYLSSYKEINNLDTQYPEKRDWKTLYLLFADLYNRYSDSHVNSQLGRQVLVNALNPLWPFECVAREARSFRLSIDVSDDWHQLEQLRKAFDDLANFGFEPETPAASVYQTAIQIKKRQLEHESDRENKQRWFYRGQRRHQWSITPLTFRDLGDFAGAGNDFLARVSRVRGAVRALQDAGLGKQEFEALAIAQHYSKELGVRPWLLDVTLSPYVALFFATDGGQDGDVGVIDYIERTEWMLFSEGAPDSVGRIRYVSPEGILRVENQAAFFIEAPHPELYDQMKMNRYYFRQNSGVVFEDASLDPPVSRDRVYPKDDPILGKLPTGWEAKSSVPLPWEPQLHTLKSPDAALFASIVRPWIKEVERPRQETVAAVCRLHAALTPRKATLPDHICTLPYLRAVVEEIRKGYMSDVEDLLATHYVPHIREPDAINSFAEAVVESCPEWSEIVSKLLKSA